MHRLLQRQLKRYVGSVDSTPGGWEHFIDAVNEAYHQADADRALLERSLDLTSEELIERNQQLWQQMMAERERTHLMEEQSLALLDVIQSVALGDLDVEVEIPEGIEALSDLAIGLEMMIDDIKEIMAELEGARTELEQHVDERTQELESALEEVLAVQQRYFRQEWGRYTTAAEASRGYLLSESEEGPTAEAWLPAMGAAVQQEAPVTESDGQEGQTLAVPISLYGEVVGVLGFSREDTEHWGEGEIAAVEAIVEQVALALENQRLFDEEQHARFLLGERVKELDCLNDIGRKIEETPPVPEFLQWAAGRIPQAMHHSNVCLVAIEFEGQVYGATEAVGLPCQIVQALRIGGKVVGRIYISYTEDHDFLNEESALLGDITRRVSGYIESHRLFEETQIQAKELVVLNEMGRALTTMLDMDAVIESLYQHASRLIDTTNFYVALYHLEQDEVSFPFYAEGDQIRQPERRRSGKGLTEYVIRTCGPLLIEEDVVTQLEELGIESIGQEAQSWLGVPMVRGEQVIGVIAVQSYTTPRLYNEHHRNLLSAIANQAAIAIENARLFQETQERIQTLSALHRAVQAVSAELDLDALTEKLVEEACCLIEADYGVLVTLDPVTGGIQRFKISGIEPGRCPLTQLPRGKGLLKLLLEGQTVRVDDIRQHPSYSGALPAGHLQIVSFLGLPLLYQDQVRGFLAVSNRATGPTFDQADEDLLGTFAAQATVTLEHARLFQETQARAVREQILREITARVRGSTDPDTIVRTAVRELGTALGRPTFVRLGNAEQLSPTSSVAQADGGQDTAQQRQRPELVEGGE